MTNQGCLRTSDEIRATRDERRATVSRPGVEGVADDLGPEDVAVGGVEDLAGVELQVGGQGEHEEAVDRADGERGPAGGGGAAQGAEPLDGGRRGPHVLVHVQAEAEVAEQEEGLLRADEVGVLEEGHGPRDFVVEDVGLLGEELLACGLFVFGDLRDDDVLEVRDDGLFADAE